MKLHLVYNITYLIYVKFCFHNAIKWDIFLLSSLFLPLSLPPCLSQHERYLRSICAYICMHFWEHITSTYEHILSVIWNHFTILIDLILVQMFDYTYYVYILVHYDCGLFRQWYSKYEFFICVILRFTLQISLFGIILKI